MTGLWVPPGGISLSGFVQIRNGQTRAAGRNHFVDQGLLGLLSCLAANYFVYTPLWSNSTPPAAYLGSDTATATTHGMSALTTPIGTSPGTAPDSRSATKTSGSSTGIWSVDFKYTWNAGTLTDGATVGEAALYGTNVQTSTTFGVSLGSGTTNLMVSRLSAADSDFSSFSIDASVNLVVTWTITLTFTT